MGKIENQLKKKIKRKNIKKAILSTIAVAGLLSVALVAPNALQVLKLFNISPEDKWKKYNTSRSLRKLIENGFISWVKKDGRSFITLTPKGKEELKKIEFNDYQFKKPKKWDGKWRVLIFDIKEERKMIRDKVRNTLVRVGFMRLQDSVWVYPYDCEDFVNLMKADFKVGWDLLYLIVDSLEGDKRLKSYFEIK